ncbi:hypothetical protein ABZ092_29815 [Streptomyces bobili]|uniref:hypothetical protein n=1 Tax=Streptomyces bobili TaxID=67280 RepID=UPI0033B8B81E
MPADEVTTGSGVDAARVRTGPRHAAPKKPLFTRFHMPAGKAIALAAMPTAVLMGMGFTPTLANAEDQPTSKSLTIDEYKDCVAALEDSEGTDASASPSPSASASASESADDAKDDSADDAKDDSGSGSKDEPTDGTSGTGDSTSPDSGSGEAADPAPAASSETSEPQKSQTSDDTATASPSPSETDKNLLETIGDTITDLFDGKDAEETATASPTPSPSESASTGTGGDTATDTGSGKDSGTAKDTSDAVTDAVKDTADKADDTAEAAEDKAAEAAADAADATASPSPSQSATTDVDDCPVSTEDESGIDNKTLLPDDPWYLNASSLLLKGADYQGIVEVKTANGTKKKVLKYVISEGTDIGDLHQTVNDKQAGVTYHVQAGSGTTSTIRNGDTIMYTESISGNLFGLIPVTFDPENPPPLNIPLIYFTKVKVVQAGQFGGDLHIPGMHLYNTK